MRSLRLVTVGVDAGTGRSVVLFEDASGAGRLLQLEIEPARAPAIEAAWRGERVAPTTLGLLGRLRAAVGRLPLAVVITVRTGCWTATVLLDGGGQVLAEPSDAVLLALADGIPIMTEDGLLDPAGADAELTPAQREQLHRFRRFLDDVLPDDFLV